MKRFSFDLVAAGVVFLAVIIVPLIMTTVLAQSPDSDPEEGGDAGPRCFWFGHEYICPPKSNTDGPAAAHGNTVYPTQLQPPALAVRQAGPHGYAQAHPGAAQAHPGAAHQHSDTAHQHAGTAHQHAGTAHQHAQANRDGRSAGCSSADGHGRG